MCHLSVGISVNHPTNQPTQAAQSAEWCVRAVACARLSWISSADKGLCRASFLSVLCNDAKPNGVRWVLPHLWWDPRRGGTREGPIENQESTTVDTGETPGGGLVEPPVTSQRRRVVSPCAAVTRIQRGVCRPQHPAISLPSWGVVVCGRVVVGCASTFDSATQLSLDVLSSPWEARSRSSRGAEKSRSRQHKRNKKSVERTQKALAVSPDTARHPGPDTSGGSVPLWGPGVRTGGCTTLLVAAVPGPPIPRWGPGAQGS